MRALGVEPDVLTLTQFNVWGDPGRLGTTSAVVSDTVNVVEQVLVLLAPSFAVTVIVCSPMPTIVPAAGLCVMIIEPGAVQLSEEVTFGTTLGIAARQLELADPLIGAGQLTVGGLVSLTITVWV